MKIEYISEGPVDCPLLRLFDYWMDEIEQLRLISLDLAEGRTTELALHDQPWIDPVAGCRFIWRIDTKDIGVRMPENDAPFVLAFSDEAWREAADKLLPFAQGSSGHNWLTNEGEVNVLITWDGLW